MRTPVKQLFHRLHNPVSKVSEVLKVIDAEFEAKKAPLVCKAPDGSNVDVATHCAIINDRNNVLSIVGSRYGIVQYSEALGVLDMAVDEGLARWVAAQATDNGARIHALMTTGQTVDFGNGDDIEFLFTVSTSHDGKMGLNFMSTPVHSKSQSVFTPMSGGGVFSLRHSAKVERRIANLKGAIAKINNYNADCAEKFKRFSQLRINDEEARIYFAMVIEEKENAQNKRSENQRAKLFDIFKTDSVSSFLPSCRGTLLGALVAVWTWADYYKTTRKALYRTERDAALESRLVGAAAQTKADGFWAAMKLANQMGESV